MSAEDNSVGPQKEQQMQDVLSKHILMDLLQLYYHRTGKFICTVFTLAPRYGSFMYSVGQVDIRNKSHHFDIRCTKFKDIVGI